MNEKEALIRVKTGNYNDGSGFNMQLLVDAVGIIGEMLKEQESTIGGWISVKDRLPEKSGKYLICAIGDGEQRVTTSYFGNYFYMTGRIAHWRVTHWMPLPEPPKEGAE